MLEGSMTRRNGSTSEQAYLRILKLMASSAALTSGFHGNSFLEITSYREYCIRKPMAIKYIILRIPSVLPKAQ